MTNALVLGSPAAAGAGSGCERSSVTREITRLLERERQGDVQAAGELLPLVYAELRKLAAAQMARQAPGQTLQATALVHEAFLRLTGGQRDQWQGRTHFFRAAAESMRCLLIENARRKSRWKRGGRLERVDLQGLELAAETPPDTLLVVQEALDRLTAEDALKAELVKLRFFIGLTNTEAAQVLSLSEPTVKRYWAYARAWLLREIRAILAEG
jgi:RNA polymerase sigma factor (TIGR02999 family)